jgi:hypothetical protein
MRDKEKTEREVFCRFVELARMPIDPASVRNERPPKPDISCRTWAGEEVSFELVQLADFRFDSRKGARDIAVEALEQAFDELVPSHPLKVSGMLANATVYVDYEFKATKIHTRQAPPHIFEWLLELDGDFEGIVDEESVVKLPPHIVAISVYRGKTNRPIFEVSFKGSQFGADQVANLLTQKLNNNYIADTPIELVAYIAGGLNFHPEVVRARFLRTLDEKADFGHFRRIWLADFRPINPTILPIVPKDQGRSGG